MQWEVSNKERDFGFGCPQICMQRLLMARDRTLPAWPDPLRLLLEYFLDAPLSSKRGERRLVSDRVNINLVNLPGGLRRAAGQPRAYKRPLGSFLAHFLSPLYSSLSIKFPRALRALRVRAFSFNFPFQSAVFVYFALEASVHFSSSLCFFFLAKC